MYYLANNSEFSGHLLQLFALEPDLPHYSFTFGNNCESRFAHRWNRRTLRRDPGLRLALSSSFQSWSAAESACVPRLSACCDPELWERLSADTWPDALVDSDL